MQRLYRTLPRLNVQDFDSTLRSYRLATLTYFIRSNSTFVAVLGTPEGRPFEPGQMSVRSETE
ncbi:MAG: hypothetical protein AAF752_07330, partial [Bacteroidota bacterium]